MIDRILVLVESNFPDASILLDEPDAIVFSDESGKAWYVTVEDD